jgi:hypothetical protein
MKIRYLRKFLHEYCQAVMFRMGYCLHSIRRHPRQQSKLVGQHTMRGTSLEYSSLHSAIQPAAASHPAVHTHARIPDFGMSQLWMVDALAGRTQRFSVNTRGA